jgi:hypothetical protein
MEVALRPSLFLEKCFPKFSSYLRIRMKSFHASRLVNQTKQKKKDTIVEKNQPTEKESKKVVLQSKERSFTKRARE